MMSGHIETGDEKGVRMAREALNKARNGDPVVVAIKESKPKTFFCAVCKAAIGKGTMTKNRAGQWVCSKHSEMSIPVPNKPSEARLVRTTEKYSVVDHPKHYTSGPVCPHCGKTVECITITEGYNFNRGNAIKYIWRAGEKDKSRELEDLEKAQWYITREIERVKGAAK